MLIILNTTHTRTLNEQFTKIFNTESRKRQFFNGMNWDYEQYKLNPSDTFTRCVTQVTHRIVITPEMYQMLPMFKELIFNSEFTGPKEPYAMLMHKHGGQGDKLRTSQTNVRELAA